LLVVSGTCPALRFRLEGRSVFTTSDTRYKDLSCSDLRLGLRIKVEGVQMSDGTVRADLVKLVDDD
jgi:hypothetical protein